MASLFERKIARKTVTPSPQTRTAANIKKKLASLLEMLNIIVLVETCLCLHFDRKFKNCTS